MKDLKNETIKKLEELKNNLSYDNESNYCDLVNTLIDYDNEAQDELYLHDTARELVDFVDEELLGYYLEYQLKEFGVDRLFYITQALTYSDTIYKVNAYGNLENVEQDDFIYVIDEIIEKLKEDFDEYNEEMLLPWQKY